jgi:hypothetical protein
LFNVRFPHDVWEGVRAAAESERRSVHQWVLLAVEDALKAVEIAPTYSDGSRVVSVPDGEPMGMVVRKAPPVELAEVSGTLPPTIDALVASGKVKRGSMVRKGQCPHRVPAGSFCKRCEEG